MAGVFDDGDYAIARCLTQTAPVSVGEVVEVDHPDLGVIVKQVSAIEAGRVRLRGTGTLSTDTVHLGTVTRSRLVSRLLWRISPTGVSRIAHSDIP